VLCAQYYQIDTFELITSSVVEVKYNASFSQLQQEDHGFQLEGSLEGNWHENLDSPIPIKLKALNGIIGVSGAYLFAPGAEAIANIRVVKSDVNAKMYIWKIENLLVKAVDSKFYAFVQSGGFYKVKKEVKTIQFTAIPRESLKIFAESKSGKTPLSPHGNINLIFQEQLEQHQIFKGKIISFIVANDVIDKYGKIIITKGAPASGIINNFEPCEDDRPLRVFIEPEWVQTLNGREFLKKNSCEFQGMPNQAYIPEMTTITVELN
jgi:hypothetical protein